MIGGSLGDDPCRSHNLSHNVYSDRSVINYNTLNRIGKQTNLTRLVHLNTETCLPMAEENQKDHKPYYDYEEAEQRIAEYADSPEGQSRTKRILERLKSNQSLKSDAQSDEAYNKQARKRAAQTLHSSGLIYFLQKLRPKTKSSRICIMIAVGWAAFAVFYVSTIWEHSRGVYWSDLFAGVGAHLNHRTSLALKIVCFPSLVALSGILWVQPLIRWVSKGE